MGGETLTVVISALVAFTLIILIIGRQFCLFARSKLVQSGDVRIIINGDEANPRVVPAGSTLLTTLSSEKLFLPSACGGGGTCAMCKCQILEGGGDVLPTEEGHLIQSREEGKRAFGLPSEGEKRYENPYPRRDFRNQEMGMYSGFKL